MCLNTVCVDRFLTGLARSPLLAEWCAVRRIPAPSGLEPGDEGRWWAAVREWTDQLEGLPAATRDAVAHELEGVAELSRIQGNAHLLEAAGADGGPPADVPSGAPVALWFLLHRPDLFVEVRRNHLHRDPDIWRAARTPVGLSPLDPDGAAARLAEALDRSFAGRRDARWHVAGHRLADGLAFLAVDQAARGPERPAASGRPARNARVQFLYFPGQGTLLLQPGLGPQEQVDDLLDCFASGPLGRPHLPGPAFDLDRLRWPFVPAPDALDMEAVRLKSLSLSYPRRECRRVLTLDTLESDAPDAVAYLLRRHVGDDLLPELSVTQAVLQVRLREDGRPRDHLVRLWRDYCDLGPASLTHRALRCLRHWGL